MRHTLKAVFAHRSDAQHVLDELLASGYSRADTASSSALATGQADCSVLEGETTAADPGALARARHLVTLAAGSDPDLERAVAIIERGGPVSIEYQDDELVHGAVDAGKDVLGTPPVYPPGTEPGALQRRAHEDTRYFGTQSADSPPTGNTFEEPMGSVSPWVRPDDGRLRVPAPTRFTASDGATRDDDIPAHRNHWTTPDAGSAGDGAQDDGEPASIDGSEARRSENYRSKDGRDAEPALAAAWKARHAGQLSPWENFKDAVHHGWHRTSRAIDDAGEDSGLKSDWERGQAGASPTWDKLKAAVRHGWDRVRH